MEKNTIWAIVLSTVVLIAFMFIQTVFFPVENVELPAATDQEEVVIITEEQNKEINSVEINEILLEGTSSEIEEVVEETVTITTQKAIITLTNVGGDIINYELIEHRDGEKGVQMADNISFSNRAFSMSFGPAANKILNEKFNIKKIDDYTVAFYRDYSVKNSTGSINTFRLTKQYVFNPEDYVFKLDIFIENKEGSNEINIGNAAYTLRTSPQIGPYYNKKNDRYDNRTFMSYTNGKKKKQILKESQTKEYDKTYTWTGIAGKYFTTLVAPMNVSSMAMATYSTQIEVDDYANAQVLLTRTPIQQSSVQDTYYIYVGPRTETLSKYNNASDNPWHLSNLRLDDSIKSTVILSWLEIGLKWIMEMLYKLIPNWGVSIIIMTILLKLVLFPLTKKSSVSTLKMQALQPRMKEIQDKYKGQPEKLNAEMSKLYQETGYNPLSGCLPMLIQFPLIIAMYNLFNNYFEFRGAMFIPGWIPDLSVGDSVYTLGFDLPFLGSKIRILPIIYVISQLLFGKITQAGNSGANNGMQMKIMMYGMPLFFFFIFYNAPSGLLLYWTVSNILSLGQQLIINKVMKGKKEEMEAEFTKKEKFIARKKK